PYVARRLTLSKRVPGYRARRHSEGPTVRFSDYIPENSPIDEDNDDGYEDNENYGGISQQYLDFDQSSLSSISIDRQFELSAIAEQSEEQSSVGHGIDEEAAEEKEQELKIVN
ncbi:hypothetical protein LPJ56_006144, partial [Coemansia sp. RSA 2599]